MTKPKIGRPFKYVEPPKRLNVLIPQHLFRMAQEHITSGNVHESMSDFVQQAMAFMLAARGRK